MVNWFLSYNSADLAVAEKLEEQLRQAAPDGNVFLAPKSLRAGGYWLPKLAEAIAEANAFVLYVGENGLGPWQVIEYYEALDKRAKQPDFPIVLVLLDGRPAPGLPFLRQLHWIVTADPVSSETVGKLRSAAGGSGGRPGELWRYTAPYRGLAAMTEADSDFFFGREQETVDVLSAMAAKRGTVALLLGNSGVGKSSLAQAGVLGALKRQAWPERAAQSQPWPIVFRESRRWSFLKMLPGVAPVTALIEPFLRTWQIDPLDPSWETRRNDWVAALTSGRASLSGLLDATERRYEELGQAKPAAFFLYVDQGEELYVRAEESQRASFSGLLRDAVADPRLYCLMSMRSDFFGALQNDSALFSVHRQINVPPLGEAALGDIVSKPPALLSARFEHDQLATDLARRAAEESARDTGALPLLSYLLDDMWTEMVRRGDGVLRLPPQAMELGGVLADRADAFLARHPDDEDRLRRLLTLKLAAVREDGEPTRRRALRSEFSDEEWRMVTDLANHPNRLLVTVAPDEGETFAEVAHEAIFKRWGKLREWIAAERGFLSWRNGLEGARRSWDAAPEADRSNALLMGLALAEAQQWLERRGGDLTAGERRFIEESRERERSEHDARERLRRRILQGTIAAMVLVTGFAAFAVFEVFEANRHRQEAETATAEAQSQKRQADRNLDAAKATVRSLVQHLAEARGTRDEMVRELLDVLSSSLKGLVAAAPGDVELLRSQSEIYNRMVDAHTTSGDVGAALAYEQQGLAIARNVFADHPDDVGLERDVSISLERLGDVKMQAGDASGALAAYLERLAFARTLLGKQPDDPHARRDLSVSLNKVGDGKFSAGDKEGALSAYEESLAVARDLAGADPVNAEAGRDVTVSLTKVGDVRIATGDFEGARTAYQESLDIRRDLSLRHPGDAMFVRDVSVSLNRLGDAKLKLGDTVGALNDYTESLELARRILSVDSGNAEARRDVSVDLNKIGDMKLDAGDRQGAFDAYNESGSIARDIAARDPANAQAQTDLVVSLTRVADVSDDPRPLYNQALEILRDLDRAGRLTAAQKGWISWVNDQLAKLNKAGADPAPTQTAKETVPN